MVKPKLPQHILGQLTKDFQAKGIPRKQEVIQVCTKGTYVSIGYM